MKLSDQQINRTWIYIVTKMLLLTKIGENKEVNMDVQITGNSLIIKILDYREIIEPNYFENLRGRIPKIQIRI